ncbi:MAG: alginate export family protein [Planctomycetia bacterium]|nr:alginate export family protein [Planctomycetia bacterium]
MFRFKLGRLAAAAVAVILLPPRAGFAQPRLAPARVNQPTVIVERGLLAETPASVEVTPTLEASRVHNGHGPPAAPTDVSQPAECECEFDWKKIPRVRPFPRIGNFPVLPTGPGYYSALDQLCGDYLKGPPKYPYPRFGLIQPSFFDVDNFSYLDDPKNTEFDFFDRLKRIRLGDNWLFVTGGDVRTRYENNYNNRLTQRNNIYTLSRLRAYGDLWYRDDFRIYAEYIGAWSGDQDLPRLAIDENKTDLLNLFVDVKLAELGGNPAYVRVGRQELLFGSQRLISPLDWANTRRTFQGVRAFRQTEKFDFDLFWVQPVIPFPNRFDSVDNNQNFVGLWATYRPEKTRTFDAYYLLLDNTNRVTLLGIPRGNFTRHTFGGRYVGNMDNWLFDVEGAMQLGSQNGRDVVAGIATAGGGYNFKDRPWNPTAWVYYDYASGGGATSGTAHTFNQLFPFGHYYLGWIDQVGRQNIHDLNFHLFLYPTKWLTTWLQFHSFWLADRRDALYNAAGVPIRRAATGTAGSHVGEEVDIVLNFHLSKHADILTGYSHLFGGEFLRNTSGPLTAKETGFYYLQFSYRW